MASILAARPVGDPLTRFFARHDVHHGWVVAAVTFFADLVAAGAAGSVGVMMLPLQIEFGWTSAEISSALGLRLALFGLIAPFAGALFNRFGLRPVMIASFVLIDAGMGLSIFMREIWQLVALWGVTVGIGAGLTALVLSATVATLWFEKRRGLIAGLALGRRQLAHASLLVLWPARALAALSPLLRLQPHALRRLLWPRLDRNRAADNEAHRRRLRSAARAARVRVDLCSASAGRRLCRLHRRGHAH